MEQGTMDIYDVIRWAADLGAQHIEMVPGLGFRIDETEDTPERIRDCAREAGLDISNYAIGANFITDDTESYKREIERVMRQVDIAARLGATRMRHDVASRPLSEIGVNQFEEDLPKLAKACERIADYAAQAGITTSVENHGYYIQASDRVQRLVHAVGKDNFRTTLDVGNFLCADENSVVAVKRNIGIASMVHLKDFYYRPSYRAPGNGWFPTAGGNFLRGAIVGQGDVDMWEVIRTVKHSGYDGYISIEFEGLEDCIFGTKTGFENALRIWNEV
jgi:sugar phosphate isomerase/epimerase